jgi:hypothetical protein
MQNLKEMGHNVVMAEIFLYVDDNISMEIQPAKIAWRHFITTRITAAVPERKQRSKSSTFITPDEILVVSFHFSRE